MIFDDRYPALAWWVQEGGTMEFGRQDYTISLVRLFDEEGLLWESGEDYSALGDALDEAEKFVVEWAKENGYQVSS
jgi:hypothetical protein